VASALSNIQRQQEAEPTVNALSPKLGKPMQPLWTTVTSSAANIQALEDRQVDPYIATGREPTTKIGEPSSRTA